MFVMRPIKFDDLEKLNEFAQKAQHGLTSLPKNRELLTEKIHHSLQSFESDIKQPYNEYYLFALEEISTGTVGGISAILSVTGTPHPIYFFQVRSLTKPRPLRVLEPIAIEHGPSEICTLYLDHPFRKGGLGKLLSLSRFLFIDAFPFRFHHTIYANMRGTVDRAGNAPFWDGIGRHFLDLNFSQVQILLAKGRDFIPEMLPPHPIYIDLLPKEIQQVIGKVHENTQPALNMLLDHGFTFTNQVDFFDGGPKIAVERDEMLVIKKRERAIVTTIIDEIPPSDDVLLANQNLDFRACLGHILLHNRTEISLDSATAAALQVSRGDEVAYISIPSKDHHG